VKRKNLEVETVGRGAVEYAPRRWPSVGSDVSVPLFQAVITGFLLSLLLTGVIWGVFELDLVRTFGITFGVSVIVAWFWRLDVVTQTLWDIEERTGLDLDRDGSVGQPRTSVRVEIASGNSQQYIDIEGLKTIEDLRQFAILGVTDRLNEREVKKKFGWPREDWQDIRDDLVRRSLLTWNGDDGSTQGVSLTELGERVMRGILDNPSPTD